MFHHFIILLLSLFLAVGVSGCNRDKGEAVKKPPLTLTVITANNSLCYYSYRGESFGFEYALVSEFARRKGMKLSVMVMNNWDDMIRAVQTGKADIIAANMQVTPERSEKVLFMKPHLYDREVVVVNRNMKDVTFLKDLRGEEISFIQSSFRETFIASLQSRIPGVRFEELKNKGVEEVLADIADGRKNATIVPSLMFKVNRRYFPDLKSVGWVSDTLAFSWGVHKENRSLKEELDTFLQDILHDNFYKKVYDAYFDNVDTFYRLNIKKFRKQFSTKFQRYKEKTIQEAKRWNIDWRLIAAQMFQESHFSATARSNRGAYGLMQLMPATMRELGVRNRRNPYENIAAGIRYVAWLKRQFEDFPEDQQMFFALAAYNVGIHHLWDAVNLARSKGLDEQQWVNVRLTLSLLTKKEYFQKAAYGYCNARETLNYVSNIMMYYDILRRENLDPVEVEEEKPLKQDNSPPSPVKRRGSSVMPHQEG